MSDPVNHPAHYGGESDPYEAIKVIEAWGLGFCLGNAVKYISRAGRKPGAPTIQDLEKARWYLDHEIQRLKQRRAEEHFAVAMSMQANRHTPQPGEFVVEGRDVSQQEEAMMHAEGRPPYRSPGGMGP